MDKLLTTISTSDFMRSTLEYFSREEAEAWFREMQKIDDLLHVEVAAHLTEFERNKNQITPELAEKFRTILAEHGISTGWNIANMEALHGYTVYAFPDNGAKKKQTGNPDVHYGLAKATSYGMAHEHHMSAAYNYIVAGEGIFAGQESDMGKFPHFYHKQTIKSGDSFEISVGMVHGHLVKKGSAIWFLFVQECGFQAELRCAGDFHTLGGYDLEQFGSEYV